MCKLHDNFIQKLKEILFNDKNTLVETKNIKIIQLLIEELNECSKKFNNYDKKQIIELQIKLNELILNNYELNYKLFNTNLQLEKYKESLIDKDMSLNDMKRIIDSYSEKNKELKNSILKMKSYNL